MSMWLVAGLVGAALTLGAFAAPAKASVRGKYICNFETPEKVAAFKVQGATAEWAKDTEDGARIEGTAFEVEAVQSGAMHLVLTPGKTYTTLSYAAANGMPADWSGFDSFSLNFENGSEFMINLHLTVADESGAKFFADNLWIFRSRNRIEIPLGEFRTASGKMIDLAHVSSMTLEIRSAEKFPRDLWLYQMYLAAEQKPVVAGTDKLVFLDFGPLGTPVMAGAKLIHEKSVYAAWRGAGWTSAPADMTATFYKRPDDLVADCVRADLGRNKATLRVDLPDGKYRARFYGGNYNMKMLAVKSFALAANGKTVAEKAVDPAKYYTKTGHFLGIDEWYETGEDPYEKYVKPFYQMYDFTFEAKGGFAEFTWTGALAAFGLLIAPAEGEGFATATAAIEEKRRASLAANLIMPKAPKKPVAATASEKKRGFILSGRRWDQPLGLYDAPKKAERSPRSLAITAARGQREHFVISATPVKPLGSVSIEVSDLATKKGVKLQSKAVEVRALRYMWTGWPGEIGEGCLYPVKKVPSKDYTNVTFWITVTPGAKAEAGVYKGTAKVTAANGASAQVALSVEVRPFALTDDHPVSFALWRCSDYNMNYVMRYFLPEKMDYFRKITDAEFADMKAHGLNAIYFNPPILKGVKGDKVILDFTLLDVEASTAKKYGMCGEKQPGMVFLLPDIARYLMKETRYGDFMEPEDLSPELPAADQVEEFSPLFNARYIDAARQIDEYFKKRGLSVLLYPVDEPRERNTNRWNRNLEDTIRYCKLIRENVPGARIYVDPMRDGNSGVDYVPMLDYVDVIGTHPWDQSSGIVEGCRDRKPILWYFNMITWDRYDFGLQQAASGSEGCWQWHYQWDLVPFQPFHSGFKWGVTIPGPNGPLSKSNYEMIAEGVTDYRYYATLVNAIASARDAGRAKREVAAAEKTIAKFMASAPPYPSREDYAGKPRAKRGRSKISGKTLDQWREAFAAHIEAIDKAK